MIDDIGLGEAIANLIYLTLIVVLITGVIFLLTKKTILGAIFWASLVLNILSILYFMGNYGNYPKILHPTVNKFWPVINLVIFIFLIIRKIRKNAKNN